MITLNLDGSTSVESLFRALGVEDYEAVLRDPANRSLVNQIARENSLTPTGSIHIPLAAIKKTALKADVENTYQSERGERTLELTVVDPLQRVQSNVVYELVLPNEVRQGTTTQEGKIKESITEDVATVVLIMKPSDQPESVQVIDIVDSLAPVSSLAGIQQRLEQRGHFIHPDVLENQDLYPSIDQQAIAFLQPGSGNGQAS